MREASESDTNIILHTAQNPKSDSQTTVIRSHTHTEINSIILPSILHFLWWRTVLGGRHMWSVDPTLAAGTRQLLDFIMTVHGRSSWGRLLVSFFFSVVKCWQRSFGFDLFGRIV